MPVEDLKQDEMMAHLMEALENNQDIGHYGRLVFAMTARHFLSDEEVLDWLKKDPDCDDAKARSILVQVEQRGYNPPRRDRVLEWMKKQGFPICPNPQDPDSCNLYKSLEFPDEVYEHIAEYREQKAEAQS